MKHLLTLGFGLFLFFDLLAQNTINLENPSFEDVPKKGVTPNGWYNCGFATETAPDVQPGSFQVSLPAQKGKTYLGMIVRDNETWESVSQRLEAPLHKDSLYAFSIWLARSESYISQSQLTNETVNYATPAKLRVWGGNGYCDKEELLWETGLIKNYNWEKHDLKLHPTNGDFRYITLEVYYATPVLFPYNGNILLDNCSPIQRISGYPERTGTMDPELKASIKLADPGPDDPKNIRIRNASFEQASTNAKDNPLPAYWETVPYPQEIIARTHPETTKNMMVKSDKDGFYTIPILKKPKAEAKDGEHYISLVARKDGTRQWISQALEKNMQKDSAYVFSLFLMHEPHFKEVRLGGKTPADYRLPVRLRIWGGSQVFRKEEVLAESVRVEIDEWKRFVFVLKPQKKDYAYITLEAYYAYEEGKTYDGNIFIDGCSSLVRVSKSSK